jgi:hypothetical protein
MRCAVKIQEDSLARCLRADSELVLPLRVGINTASCYIGDLGSGDRIEFTVVGNGVNFAKRLESACEMHSILVGATTYDLVRGQEFPDAFFKVQYVQIKHHHHLTQAHSFDPFTARAEDRQAADQAFRSVAKIQRFNERFAVEDPTLYLAQTNFGNAVVLNYSATGISIRLSHLIPRESLVKLVLQNKDGSLWEALHAAGLHELECEVRWSFARADYFVHGLKFKNIPESKRVAFLDAMTLATGAEINEIKNGIPKSA